MKREVRCGRKSAARRPLPAMLLLVLAAPLAACGTNPAPNHTALVYPGSEPYRVAAPMPPPKPDLEEDGLEAQTPPPIREHVEPDDPSEPFSRNYGTRRAKAVSALPEPAPARTPSPSAPLRTSALDDTRIADPAGE